MKRKESAIKILRNEPKSVEDFKKYSLIQNSEESKKNEEHFESFASIINFLRTVIDESEEENKKLEQEKKDCYRLNEILSEKLSNLQESLNIRNKEFIEIQHYLIKILFDNKRLNQNLNKLEKWIYFKESDISNLEKKPTDVQNDFNFKVFQSENSQPYFDIKKTSFSSISKLSLIAIIFIVFFWMLTKLKKRLVNKNARTSFANINDSMETTED